MSKQIKALKKYQSQIARMVPKYLMILAAILLIALIMSLLWPDIRGELIDIEQSDSKALVDQTDGIQTDEMTGDEAKSDLLAPNDVTSKSTSTYPIYLTGAVMNPGIYYLQADQILADAVVLAGGLTEDAAIDIVNLAMIPIANQMIRIPRLDEVSDDLPAIIVDSPTQTSEASTSQLININLATEAELCTLPGIGLATAKAIIAWREDNGSFESIEDIMLVSGIKEARFNQIKTLITV